MSLTALPPVHSPVAARALPAVVAASIVRGGGNAREALSGLLAARYRAESVLLCDSGTHALQLALARAAVLTGRDAAALPGFSCYNVATAGAAVASRLEFYDIDVDTLAPSPDSVDAALATGVGVLVAVHPFGMPMDVEALRERAAAAGAIVVEDAAQGYGGARDGVPLGALAEVSVLSFGRGKGWTGGGGGAVLLRGRAATAELAPGRALAPPPGAGSLLGKLLVQWALGRPSLYGIPSALPWLGLGETHFVPPSEPRQMAEAAAAMALSVTDAAEQEAAVRRQNAAALRDRLAAIPDLWLPPLPRLGDVPGFLRLPLRFPGRPSATLSPRARRFGILPSYPLALSRLPQVAMLVGTHRPTPGADALARELFTAPVHRWVNAAAIDAMVRTLALKA